MTRHFSSPESPKYWLLNIPSWHDGRVHPHQGWLHSTGGLILRHENKVTWWYDIVVVCLEGGENNIVWVNEVYQSRKIIITEHHFMIWPPKSMLDRIKAFSTTKMRSLEKTTTVSCGPGKLSKSDQEITKIIFHTYHCGRIVRSRCRVRRFPQSYHYTFYCRSSVRMDRPATNLSSQLSHPCLENIKNKGPYTLYSPVAFGKCLTSVYHFIISSE